jgi:GAF domain-containing protein
MLHDITILINFIFLIVAVWLGIYVVTRSPRSLVAWLTGLTLWSVAGLFLNMLLALNPPPLPADMPSWVPLLLPFWPEATPESGWSGWLQGWLVIPAIVLWHHATVLMRPDPMNRWRWTRVILGYVVAIAAILIHLYTPLMFSEASGDPLFLTTLKPGALYPLFISLLLVFTALCLINLLRSARSSPSLIQRKQLNILALATLIAGLTGPVALIAAAFSIPFPRVTISMLLGIPVLMLGFGVARYSALMEGRTIRRDFAYNAIAMGLVAGLYLLVTWISSQMFHVAAAVFIFLVLLSIVTHSLIDTARQSLDFFFYRGDKRSMRRNLRRLDSFVGEQELEENLSLILDTMCVSVRATYGMIISFEQFRLIQITTYQRRKRLLPVSQGDLVSDDVLHLEPGTFPSPLDDAALLIPLYADTEQLGVIILGRPVNGIRYSNTDVELLLYPSDQVADAIQDSLREKSNLAQISQIAQTQKAEFTTRPEVISVEVVDDALRNLFDFAHLGDIPLVELNLVQQQLSDNTVTHIDLGKAVHTIITQVLEKLRPEDQLPGEPVPREWHPYLILHGAYLEDRLNRDIMSQLYISEGTFNRTRRSAIRSVTRMLEEMEAALG